MYEYYQVKHLEMHYVPYRFQGGATVSTIFNNYTIIQPDDAVAAVNGAIVRQGLYSFGNARIHQGYEHVKRGIQDFTNLAISKQNEVILKTNGSAASRQLYIKPATIGFYGTANDFGSTLQGEIVYKVHYVFSGMKRPDVALPNALINRM